MKAGTPEQICELFRQYMLAGDLDSLLSLYEADVAFLNQSGQVRRGWQELRAEIAPFVAAKARFDFDVRQVVQSGDIALMHTAWNISSPQQISVYAIEVARRQSDGSWRWVIGDPFTVGKQVADPTLAIAKGKRGDTGGTNA
jgi:uncharacterized protein (TIGR02246 family)